MWPCGCLVCPGPVGVAMAPSQSCGCGDDPLLFQQSCGCGDDPLLFQRSCGCGDDPLLFQICSEPCGKGIVEYDVTCTNTTNDTIIEEGFCNADERPDEQRNCFLRNCPGIKQQMPKKKVSTIILTSPKRLGPLY